MSSRNEILASLRRGLRRGAASEAQQEAVRQRLQHHPRTLIPARGQQPGEARVELFIRMAREAAAEVVVLASIEQLPAAVAQTLASEGERELVVADVSASPRWTGTRRMGRSAATGGWRGWAIGPA